MRAAACTFVLLFAAGCADLATIGGLCLEDCTASDAGLPPCSAAACPDAAGGSAGRDSCAADGCELDLDAGQACGRGSYALTRMRSDLMFIVDDSISISPWFDSMNQGLEQFLQSTAPSGLGVGLQRFDEACEPEKYTAPLVPIAPLEQNLHAMLDAIPFAGVVSTSTVPALDGVHRYARLWAANEGDARVSVVLLTDATPGACDGLVGDHEAEAQRIARAALEVEPAVKTYVVGFSTLPGISTIARAGGTEPELISVTPVDGEVRAALETIRQSSQPCVFRWHREWTLAPDSAVVINTVDGAERRYPLLSSSADCADQDGFYIEDPTAAFPLIACARTCSSLVPTDEAGLSSACFSRD